MWLKSHLRAVVSSAYLESITGLLALVQPWVSPSMPAFHYVQVQWDKSDREHSIVGFHIYSLCDSRNPFSQLRSQRGYKFYPEPGNPAGPFEFLSASPRIRILQRHPKQTILLKTCGADGSSNSTGPRTLALPA